MREVWDVVGIDLQPNRHDACVIAGGGWTAPDLDSPKNVEVHSDGMPSNRTEVLCCAQPVPQFCLGA